ncbi:hypothetical protein FQA39_LY06737 [Lamprigera yunnana]|nr:hypothetical protein FQA39_LY06737 [Lamprigera yunnana]
MSWSREEVICLIEEYRKWPNLYKVKSVNYKNRNLRKTALESIENSLKKSNPNIASTEIQNKFQSLKQNALKEYKKWKNSYKNGAGEDEVYEPSLWYFQIISFVIADNVPRESQDTLDGTENTETQIQEFDSVMDPSINKHESEYEEVYSGSFTRWKVANLYKVKSVNYKNRNLRKTALESIENSLKKSNPNITSTEIQNKFQSLKQNALKEYKKWKNSYKNGAGEDEVYEPSLWYFQIISFVIADNVPRESQDTLDGTENTETQIQEFDSVMDPSINKHKSEYEEVYSGIVSPDGSVSLEGVPFVSNNEKRSHSAMSVPGTSTRKQMIRSFYKLCQERSITSTNN